MSSLLTAFEASLKGNKETVTADNALIETGRSIARAIDDVLNDEDAKADAKVKALYLTPHLVGILRELLATPAARKSFGVQVAEAKGAGRLALIKDQASKHKGA